MTAVKHPRNVVWCWTAIIWMMMLLTVVAEDNKPSAMQASFEVLSFDI